MNFANVNMAVHNKYCDIISFEQVIAHDLQTGEPLDWLPHEEPVYGLSVHPSQVCWHQNYEKLENYNFLT